MNKVTLLSVESLSIGFATEEASIRVVEDVSFAVASGETLGLVGESGCGKSVTAQTIMRLLPSPPARIEAGRIVFGGIDLATASEAQMRKIRGNDIAMIFQEPMTSLNPTMTIGARSARPCSCIAGARPRDARPPGARHAETGGHRLGRRSASHSIRMNYRAACASV